MLTYFKRHFAQLNKHNLPRQHATKVIAVLLQYIKALNFRVLTLKTNKGKNGNITFNIYVQHYQYSTNTYCLSWHTNAKNCITQAVAYYKKCPLFIRGLFFCLFLAKKNTLQRLIARH